MSLANRLENIKKGFIEQAPKEVIELMTSETEKLKAEDFLKNIPKIGDKLINGELVSRDERINLYDSLDSNKSYILSFYRGGWCPYCCAELEALEEIKSEVESLGAEIIAITPEDQAHVKETKQKTGASFTIYSDQSSSYAKSLNLAHSLPESLQEIYLKFGVNVEKHNGESLFDLPIPSTIIIDKNKEIQYVFADGDYTERSNPEVLLEVIKNLKDL